MSFQGRNRARGQGQGERGLAHLVGLDGSNLLILLDELANLLAPLFQGAF